MSHLLLDLGRAAEIAQTNIDEENTRVKEMRDRLEQEILKRVPRDYTEWRQEQQNSKYNQYQL